MSGAELVVTLHWNGKLLRVGRLPAYGVEAPNLKRPPGAIQNPPEVWRLGRSLDRLESLFAATAATVLTYPSLSPNAGTLRIRMTLTEGTREVRFVENDHEVRQGTLGPETPIEWELELGEDSECFVTIGTDGFALELVRTHQQNFNFSRL